MNNRHKGVSSDNTQSSWIRTLRHSWCSKATNTILPLYNYVIEKLSALVFWQLFGYPLFPKSPKDSLETLCLRYIRNKTIPLPSSPGFTTHSTQTHTFMFCVHFLLPLKIRPLWYGRIH